jgi:hypothetical protein
VDQRALFKNKNYDISDFDKDMKLKFGFNNLVFVACLMSPLIIAAIASSLASKGAVNYLDVMFGNIGLMGLCIATTIPAILYLGSNVLLSEKSAGLVKTLASNSYSLLKIGAICNMLAWLTIFVINKSNASVFQVIFLSLGICLVIYSYRSKRLYDYFISSTSLKH